MLQELDYDYTLHQNRYKMDHKLYVRFFMATVPDQERSDKEGRKCFKDVEMVQIMVPGDKKNIIVRAVREEEKMRFPELYNKWKQNREQDVLDGYPLNEWTHVSPSMVEELRYLGFRTVEHVAGASDAVCSKFAGLQELKRRAQAWIEIRAKEAPLEQAQTELNKRDEKIAAMEAEMAAMRQMMAELKAKAAA